MLFGYFCSQLSSHYTQGRLQRFFYPIFIIHGSTSVEKIQFNTWNKLTCFYQNNRGVKLLKATTQTHGSRFSRYPILLVLFNSSKQEALCTDCLKPATGCRALLKRNWAASSTQPRSTASPAPSPGLLYELPSIQTPAKGSSPQLPQTPGCSEVPEVSRPPCLRQSSYL